MDHNVDDVVLALIMSVNQDGRGRRGGRGGFGPRQTGR